METIDYTIEPSKEDNYPTLGIQQSGRITYLHSRISPSKENTLLKSRIEQITQDTVIVFGSGLGYSLEPIQSNIHIRRVIIIERLAGIENHINKLFTHRDNCEYHYLSGLDCDTLENKLTDIIDLTEVSSIAFIDHPASLRLFPDYYSHARDAVDRVINSKAGNAATLKSFSALYLKNAIKNIACSPSMSPVNSLTGLWNGFSCVIVSSAPSIDHYINLIKKYESKVMILAVDSAYPICRAHNIVPDAVITVDPQPWTEEHLIHIDPSIPVISSLTSHSRRSQKSFISLNSHPLSQIFEHFFSATGSVDSHTGTVAGDAIKAASVLGAKRIYLAGLDFSFPDHLIYSKDSAYNHRYSFLLNNRLNSSENSHEKYIRRSSATTQIDGIRTRKSFIQFRDAVSSMLKDSKDLEFIHLLKGGITIPGSISISDIKTAEELFNKESPAGFKISISDKMKESENHGLPDIHALRQVFSDRELINQAINASVDLSFPKRRIVKIQLLLKTLLENT